LLHIRKEIEAVVSGQADAKNNILKHAPHTQWVITANEWDRPYSRQEAAFPLAWVKANKFWPTVSRVNNTAGDRNLVCTCEPIESYMEA
jgi:glycine dehydrogenase